MRHAQWKQPPRQVQPLRTGGLTPRRSPGTPTVAWVSVAVLITILALPCVAQELPPPRPLPPASPPPSMETNRTPPEGANGVPTAACAAGETGPLILPPGPTAPPPTPAIGVTLPDVLRLAFVSNLDIEQARLVVERARATRLRARSTMLPNLNLGSTYVHHEGQIQRTEGNVITVNRDSLFAGGGPSLSTNLGVALFAPHEAQRILDASRFGQVRVTNNTLLAVADAYFEVLRARRRLARADETLEFLTSEQGSTLRADSKGLLPLIRDFKIAGAKGGLPSDLARVETDVARQRDDRESVLSALRQTSAALAYLLNVDPTGLLLPLEDFRWPLRLPGDEWVNRPIEDLVTFALQNRPEISENGALVEAALVRFRSAQWRPLVPNVVVNYNWGGFGGGPDLIRRPNGTTFFAHSGNINNFDTRTDFDVSLIWRLDNMGLGNLAEQRDTRLQYQQARVQQQQAINQVITQVVIAQEQVLRNRDRVRTLQAALFDEKGNPGGSTYRSIRLNFLRIRAGEGFPLEVLDAIRRLSDVLEAYANALTEYDRARIRLLITLGVPPQTMLDPNPIPLPLKEGTAAR